MDAPEVVIRVEAWGELCIPTVPDQQARVLRAGTGGRMARWWLICGV